MTQQPFIEVPDDTEAASNAAYEAGWTDGLPIVPPTRERVDRMMAALGRRPDEVIANLSPDRADATIESVAINAVMAGCHPRHFPLVVASVEAVASPEYELFGVNTTTNPTVPFIIVNGPIRNELDINCSWSVLGPRKQANAVIGRALSLVMMNIAGRVPEQTCKATWKMPGAYTMCAGEYEEESPWAPLHVERGFQASQNTVTLMSPNAAFNMCDTESQNAEELLRNMVAAMLGTGGNNFFPFYGLGEVCIMMSPGHAKLIAETHSKDDVRQYFLENLKIPVSYVSPRRVKMMEAAGHGQVEDGYVRYAKFAWQFLIFVAGGLGGYHSAGFTTFGDSRPVTRVIPDLVR